MSRRDGTTGAERTGRGAIVRAAGSALLLLLSLTVTLALFECGVRVAGYSPLHDVYSKPSVFWQHDELLGWSHEPGATGTYVGPRPWPIEFESRVEINALGLRGPEIGAKPPGGYRILVLGDSVVAAFEVEYEETFTALVQEALAERFDFPVEVVNAGVRGYGTDQSLLWLRERGAALEPDMVVFFHSDNDLLDNVTLHRLARPLGKGGFRVRPDRTLEPVGIPVPRYPLCRGYALDDAYRAVRTDGAAERLFCFLETRLADHSALFTFATYRIRAHPEIVKGLHRLLGTTGPATRGASLAPTLPQAEGRTAGQAVREELVTELVRQLGVQAAVLDVSFVFIVPRREIGHFDLSRLTSIGVEPVFLEGTPDDPSAPLQFRHDSHYTAAGHRFVAGLLTPVLEARIRADRGVSSPPAAAPSP